MMSFLIFRIYSDLHKNIAHQQTCNQPLIQVINSEAEDSDGDDVTEEEEEDQISGPFTTLTARPPIDIEELARHVVHHLCGGSLMLTVILFVILVK
jgi:hypothetical protein